jgi:class 3 adenylate cyclase
MEQPRQAVHRTILVVDVEGFGDQRRTNQHRLVVRDGMYRALQHAFTSAGIAWDACYQESCGDGVFVLIPAEVPKGAFVASVPDVLAAALREHNAAHAAGERIRLRMALHAGEVYYDEHGVTAASINLAFRLLDAAPLKAALAGSPGTRRPTGPSRSRSRRPPPWPGSACRISPTRRTAQSSVPRRPGWPRRWPRARMHPA